MALQFVLGGSGSGKSEYVKEQAIRIAKEDRKNNVLIIVPDQFTMQTQWQMANSHPDGGILNIDVLSFSRLPRKVFEEVGQPRRMLLDDTGKCLLIKRGATKIKSDLRVLSKGMDNAGWSGEVKSVLSEFMQYNVSPDELDGIKDKCRSIALKQKLSDLKLLYEVFLKECEEKYITREEILDMFVERLPLSKKIEKSIVFFDGFTGFTPIQIKAIVAIAKKAKEVIITFPFENDLNEDPYTEDKDNLLFDLTRKNIASLKRACEGSVEILKEVRCTENYRHKNNPELAYLEKNLFRKGEDPIASSGAIELSGCTDIDSECHELCEKVLREIKANNYRYRDVAVICADMTKYQKTLEKYLERYNIPYYMDANRSIANNTLVKYILSITEIVKNKFRIEDVLKMLRTGISPFEDEEIDLLENYIYARGIKGIAKWKTDFVYPSEEQKKIEGSLEEVNGLRKRFFGIFEEIIKFVDKKRKLSAWVKDIYDILEAGNIAEKMSDMSAMLKEEHRTVEAMEYGSVYNSVIEVFDELTDLMGDEDYTIKEFSDILKVGFSEIRVGVLPQTVDSLLVGDMQRTRLKEIKELFIVGVNDGNIPKSGTGGGLLSVPDKEELKNEAECTLAPTNDELAYIEQLYIYLNLTKPTDKLFLSYATIGGKGESLVPSYLMEVLKNMYTGLEVKKEKKDSGRRLFIADVKEDTARLMGMYVSGLTDADSEKKLFENMAILKGIEGGKEWCEKIIENSFREYSPVPLEKETAKALYGELLNVSISTLEQFALCRYAHFVGYGLGLCEREEYGLEYVDMGNLAHNVLENVGKDLHMKGLDFSNADEEALEKEIDLAVERLTNGYDGDLLQSDEKTAYYATQLSRIMKRTAKTLGFQLSKGKYRPEGYEERFEKEYEGHNVRLRGKIDRMDIYSDDSGNKYVKILDYKSSRRTLDPEMIKEGLSLQLAIYMKNAIETVKERYPGKNVLPAAMLYYAIDDPFVDDRDNTEAAIRKILVPEGAIVNDEKIMQSLDEALSEPGVKSEVVKITKKKDNTPDSNSKVYSIEDFNAMLNTAEEKALELSDAILAGSIDINPTLRKKVTACDYCALKGVCGFDPKIKGYEYRVIGEKTEDADEDAEQ